ncbi:MAG: hypothetical protein A2V75_06870 [Actinobacteria bacterium RBG_16_70_17]|nr:MAG: hypothetical protein A2V75_06870 [Actinobacteria bacterium RBG_16_70_17]
MPSALTPFDGFDLRVITEADLPLLAGWHADRQVYEWWEGRPLSEEEVRAEYVDNDEPVTCCLVHLDGRPIGYLQFYRYEVAEWRAAVSLGEGEDAWGIDLFLAEEADRGRGVGTRLLAGTLARLSQERGASLVLIDPHLDNPRAIACYRKAGFVARRMLPAHEERAGVLRDALLMAWRPPGPARLAEAAPEGQSVRCMADEPLTPETTLPYSPRLDRFQRVARWIILTSVFLNALLGIWAVAGSLGEVESRILFTSLLITACGAVAVACSTAIPERRLGPVAVPVAGIVIAAAGFSLIIASLWEDFRTATIWQAGTTMVVVAVGIAFAALLSGVSLSGRYRRLVPTAYALAGMAGAFLIAVTWGFRAGEAWRLLGIVGVLLLATTLAAPIAARLRPAREAPPPVRHCPYCGRTITETSRRAVSCPSCGRRFRVESR